VAAQGFEVGPGLVIEIETTTTAPAPSESLQQGLQQGLNGALVALSDFLSQGDMGELSEAMEGLGPPETITQDVTVYIKGARIRVDIGANSLLGRLAPDGSVSEWAVLDRASGQVMDSDFFNRAIQASSAAEYEAFGGDAEVIPTEVSVGSELRTIQGHQTRKHTITKSAILATAMEGETGTPLGAMVNSTVDAWVATDGPYTEDAGIVQFFRVFGQELNLMPQPSASNDGLPQGAIVLEAHEVANISIGSVGTGELLATASSSTVVKGISRQELDDELFSAFEAEEQECKCSCEEFEELQAIGRLPKAQQQNEPRAMFLSMCAPKCGVSWAMNCGSGGC
jgi:hypothetical protein